MKIEELHDIFNFVKHKLSSEYARELYTKVSLMVREEIDHLVEEKPQSKVTNVIEYLDILSGGIEALSEKHRTICEMLKKELRFLILVLTHYPENIRKSLIIADENGELLRKITEISAQIGVVPRLNEMVPLPPEGYLPTQYKITSEKSKKIAWVSPGRDNVEEPLVFFQKEVNKHKVASARLYLIDQDGTEDKKMARGYADANFFLMDVGNLHADHLQPSEAIVMRQLEMVEAMNLDPKFKQEMIIADKGQGYFIENDEGGVKVLRGTKKFYLEYHNCVGNIWFISAAANSGCGKGNMDVIDWLQRDMGFGEPFFDAIGGVDSVNKKPVLYVTKDGELLATAARRWFKETHKDSIGMANFFDIQVTPSVKRAIIKADQGAPKYKRRRCVRVMTGAIVMEETTKFMEDSESSPQSSIASDDAKVSPENLSKIKQTFDPKRKLFRSFLKSAKKEYVQSGKKSLNP